MSNSVRSNRFRTRVMAAAAGGALLMATGSTAVASAQPGLNTTESNNADSKPDSKPDSGNQTSQPGLNTTPAEESPAPQGNQGDNQGGNSFEGVSDSNTDYIEEAPQADPAPQEAPVENQTPQAPEQQAAPQPEQQPAPQYQDQAPAVPAQPQPEQQPVEQKPVEPQLSEYEQAVHDLTSNYEQVSLAATAPPQCGEGATPACDAANGAAQAAEKFTQVINADGMIANAAAALETNSTTNQAVIDASHTANANADQRVAQAQQYGDTTNAAIAGFDQNIMGGQGDMESYGL